VRVTLIILMVAFSAVACSQARDSDSQASGENPVAQTGQSPPAAIREGEEKAWWQWWKPAPPEPVYQSEVLRRAMAAHRSTQKPWWAWWEPSPPDPSDPDYINKQQEWMRYQQKKQMEEFERMRDRHEAQVGEQRKHSPTGLKRSPGMLESIHQIPRGQ
jgi:hypothetical protein